MWGRHGGDDGAVLLLMPDTAVIRQAQHDAGTCIKEEISQNTAPTPSKPKHSPRTGLLLYSCSTLFTTVMSTQAKLLSLQQVPVFEIVFSRSLFLLVMSSATVYQSGLKPLGNRRWLLLLRGVMGFCSVSSTYWAVSLLPLGDATALSFLAPLVVAFTSPILLREKLSVWHLVSLPLCLTGVLLVAQPTSIFPHEGTAVNISMLGLLVGCGQAVFSAGAKMCVRALRTTDEDEIIMLYMAVVSTVGSGLLSAAMPAQHWRAPTSALGWLMLIAGIGLAGFGNQYCSTAGLRWSPSATSAMSLSYLAMVWALLLGLIVFEERPGLLKLSGCAIIVASTLGASLMDSYAAKRKNQKEAAADVAAAASKIEMSDAVRHTQLHVEDGFEDTRPLLQPDHLEVESTAQHSQHTQQGGLAGAGFWQHAQQTQQPYGVVLPSGQAQHAQRAQHELHTGNDADLPELLLPSSASIGAIYIQDSNTQEDGVCNIWQRAQHTPQTQQDGVCDLWKHTQQSGLGDANLWQGAQHTQQAQHKQQALQGHSVDVDHWQQAELNQAQQT